MAHHVVLFSESITGTGVDEYVAPANDQVIRPSGNGIIVPATNNLVGALALAGTGGTHGVLTSPSLRAVNPYSIHPAQNALVPGGGYSFPMHPESPIALVTDEELDAEVNQNDATAEQVSVLAFLAPGALAPKTGKIFPVEFTITVAQLAGAWAFTPINFVNDLPVGTYDVVGGSLIAAGGIAWRLVFVGGGIRPGAPCHQSVEHREFNYFRNGGLDTWGTFEQVQPPSIELAGSAAVASATYTGVLDVIKH